MKASEMIAKLVELIAEDGDLEVRVRDQDGYPYRSTAHIYTDHSWGSFPEFEIKVERI